MKKYNLKLFPRVKNIYKFFITLITLQMFLLTSVNAQIGRVIRPIPGITKAAPKILPKVIPVSVKFNPVARQSINPAFNAASQSVVRRENIAATLRSSGIRKNFNVATNSQIKAPAVIKSSTKPLVTNFGKYAVGKTNVQTIQNQANRQVFDLRKLFSSRLSPRAKAEVGKAFNEATSQAAAINALKTQSLAIKNHFNKIARLHKNRNFYRGQSHAYVIVGPDGRLYKIGESSAGLQKTTGLSKRAQSQVNKLNREHKKLNPNAAGEYKSRIISTFTSKQEAKEFERQIIVRYIRKYKTQRNVLPGNKESFSKKERN